VKRFENIGVSQENLIQIKSNYYEDGLMSKRAHVPSKIFQELDAYLLVTSLEMGTKRHPKMSKIQTQREILAYKSEKKLGIWR
jgi:hypothetical protein